MDVSIDEQASETVATVTGEVDADNCATLGTALLDTSSESKRLVVNLAAVTFIDSSGISELLKVSDQVGERGQEFELRDPAPPIRRILEITGLLSHFGLA